MLLKVETNNKNNLYDYEENKVYISCKDQKGEDNRERIIGERKRLQTLILV